MISPVLPFRASVNKVSSVAPPDGTLFLTFNPKLGSLLYVIAAAMSTVFISSQPGKVYETCIVRAYWFVHVALLHLRIHMGKPA
jgi:hypothetical protein